MIRVCFVCLGNICRSPTAHGIMEHLVEREGLNGTVVVASAGTAGYHVGELPDPRTRSTARARGIELRSRASHFTAPDFERFDYVLAMDDDNLRDLRGIAPKGAHDKLHLFRSFDPDSPRGASVPDPYYGGSDGFEDVYDICEAACQGLLEHLRRSHGI